MSEGPLELYRTTIAEEWIDYNGHMNVTWYLYAFDRGVDGLAARIGLTEEHRQQTGGTIFAAEGHLTYQRELKLGDPIIVTLQLLGWDRKRIHTFWRMLHAEEGYLAATGEFLSLYVNLESRRTSDMPKNIQEALAEIAAEQEGLPWPAEAGRAVRFRRSRTS